jgi:glycine oxidase
VKVTVIGAGVVGCAIAHELASRGASVQVIDSRGVGRGATRASAGILAPQIEGHIPALRRLTACSLSMYDAFIARVEADAGRPVEYHRSGTLQAAMGGQEATELEADARALAALEVEHQWFDGDAVRRLEPALSASIVAGLVVPSHGHVRASELTQALAAAAEARGARLSRASVLGIEGHSTTPRVATSSGHVDSDAVVVASGSWMVDSRPSAPPPVRPIRGQLLQLQSRVPCSTRVIWGRDCYLVPWRDGTVFVGATVEDVGFDERSTAAGVRGLLDAATRLVPSLGEADFQEVRVGLRPRGADELPIIGRSDTMPAVFYAVGHYRNGVLLAPLTAALVADLVIDGRERPELASVTPGRVVEEG